MNIEYAELLAYAPEDYPGVNVFNKKTSKYENKKIYRKYISYGKSPEFKDTGKSYMFNNQEKEIPQFLIPLLNWARKHSDSRYNNVYVNWYKDGNDYIDPHSDCIDSLEKDSKILIVNYNEGEYCRTFKIQHKINPDDYEEIKLDHNLAIELDASEQVNYRHWIDKEDTKEGRISVTFRVVKEEVLK